MCLSIFLLNHDICFYHITSRVFWAHTTLCKRALANLSVQWYWCPLQFKCNPYFLHRSQLSRDKSSKSSYLKFSLLHQLCSHAFCCNNFPFSSVHNLQIKGITTQIQMRPSNTCLFCGIPWTVFVLVLFGLSHYILFQYINNSIGAASCICAKLKNVITLCQWVSLCFTFTLSMSGGRRSTNIHYNPTNS